MWDNLELLGIKFPRAPIEYEPDHGKRYLIKKLYIMDWVQLDKEDPDQNDVWSLYLPPRVGYQHTRFMSLIPITGRHVPNC